VRRDEECSEESGRRQNFMSGEKKKGLLISGSGGKEDAIEKGNSVGRSIEVSGTPGTQDPGEYPKLGQVYSQ